MLIRNGEVAGRRADLRIGEGRIVEIAPTLAPRASEPVFDAEGGALLRGLHDHHLHLLALAARLDSIDCGPPRVETRAELEAAIARATPDDTGWLRGADYFESVAGDLDRDALDALCPDRPLRIQHRSGALWMLNSAALSRIGLDGSDPDPTPTGVDRDGTGRPTGRLFRVDEWLRARLPDRGTPDLGRVGRLLAACGVTGVTDATPSNDARTRAILRGARRDGALPQRIRLMGGLELASLGDDAGLTIGEHKRLLDEPALPGLDGLVAAIRSAHDQGRAIALHAVTRLELHFALAALDEAGAQAGDRIEHASVAPPETIETTRRLGLTIVTQPGFVFERGDAYRAHVDRDDQPHLYRLRSWVEADVPLAGGTDAPFGDPDPWQAMRAAVERRTRTGESLGASEALSPEAALALFAPPDATGRPAASAVRDALASGRAPAPRVGEPADLCLLDASWSRVREDLARAHVAATFLAGERIA